MSKTFPSFLRIAKREANKSKLRFKVGACLVNGKSIVTGYNKDKTHPKYANPQVHEKTSIHAELDCIKKSRIGYGEGAKIFVYRETADKKPALARPCEHCIKFLRKAGVRNLYYTIPEFPYWEEEFLV